MQGKEKWNIPIANILTILQYLNTITMQNLLQAKIICTIIHPIWSTRPGTYVVTQVLRLPTYITVQIQQLMLLHGQLQIDGLPFEVINVPGDGNCFFYSF